jgi:hypothetical protein
MKYEIKEQRNDYDRELKLKHLGPGEWIEEPDSLRLEYRGCEALISRTFKIEPFSKKEHYYGGHLCGYVQILKGDNLFNRDDLKISCHGGLTFQNRDEERFWLGFDCAHSGDYCPSIELMRKNNPEMNKYRELMKKDAPKYFGDLLYPSYKNIQFCIDECISIIDQIKGHE